jgi:hypothetical protein
MREAPRQKFKVLFACLFLREPGPVLIDRRAISTAETMREAPRQKIKVLFAYFFFQEKVSCGKMGDGV